MAGKTFIEQSFPTKLSKIIDVQIILDLILLSYYVLCFDFHRLNYDHSR